MPKTDDLTTIRGIGPQNAAKLRALGVRRIADIAAWSAKDEARFGEALRFAGRIEREKWVAQARALSNDNVAPADAVSSYERVSGTTPRKPRRLLEKARRGRPDDLTVIKGIGPIMEAKLNAIGIFHVDQLARLGPAELTWLGDAVGQSGRPQKQDWQGSAERHLAIQSAGKAT
ncbi:MAG: helix-hairpin-helix domain-containing protein [Ahrensia sp.]|nr:helix-hairpin-helix domain-containing protein [Ahrensia sp.]